MNILTDEKSVVHASTITAAQIVKDSGKGLKGLKGLFHSLKT